MKTADKIKRLQAITRQIRGSELRLSSASDKLAKLKKEATSILKTISPADQLLYDEKLSKVWKI
jgi:hypothetical protein